MYGDLVKRLRDIASHDSNIESNYIGLALSQAADAIEKLSKELIELKLLTCCCGEPPKEE